MLPESKLIESQYKIYSKEIDANNKIECVVRWDDKCGNKHNSFSITGTTYTKQSNDRWYSGGCIYDGIKKYFPELSHLIYWNFFTSEGYMYLSNITYQASDKDCDGLKDGEYSAYKKIVKANITVDNTFINVLPPKVFYTNKQTDTNLEKHNIISQKEIDDYVNNLSVDWIIEEVPELWSLSKGKEVDIDAARSCANFPDATLEQLRDEQLLKDRLPELMLQLKKDIEALGMVY